MYEMKTAADVLQMLGTDRERGLTRSEAMERKAKYGANKLKDQEQKSVGQMILEQLNDPLILILVVAMAISLMLHELGDAIIIITVVVLNATVGIIQEGKAGKAVEALKKISSPQAVVLREGKRMKIDAEDLVQGDIVLLEAGNMIPADLRLLDTQGVCIEESTLTGESVPVEKEAGQQLCQYGLYVYLCDQRPGPGCGGGYRHGYPDRSYCGYASRQQGKADAVTGEAG